MRQFLLMIAVVALVGCGTTSVETPTSTSWVSDPNDPKDVDLLFVAVPAEDSGLTHKVKIRSETVAEGIKYPWMSSLVDINADGHLDIMYYGHHGGGAAI